MSTVRHSACVIIRQELCTDINVAMCIVDAFAHNVASPPRMEDSNQFELLHLIIA